MRLFLEGTHMGLGIPELFIIRIIGVIYPIPIAAAIWLLPKVKQMFQTQQEMAASLKAIEQTLDRR